MMSTAPLSTTDLSGEAVTVLVAVEEGAIPPGYATEGSAGLDLRAFENVELAPLERRLVSTGLRVSIPAGYEGQVRPRSGLAIRHGLSMVNTPGTIDCDYRGEIKVALINLGADVVQLSKGERIAQLVICPVARASIRVVAALDETTRGEGGFGSTGSR
jgi:dUTP pyrophosphatase